MSLIILYCYRRLLLGCVVLPSHIDTRIHLIFSFILKHGMPLSHHSLGDSFIWRNPLGGKISVRGLWRGQPTAEVYLIHKLLVFFDNDLLRQFGFLLSFLTLLLFLL